MDSLDDIKAEPFYCIGRIEGVLDCEMYESALERLEAIRKVIEEFDAAQKAYIESLNGDNGKGGAK